LFFRHCLTKRTTGNTEPFVGINKKYLFFLFFFYLLWPQAWFLTHLPEVFLFYIGSAAGIEPELLSFASGTATLPISYARPLWETLLRPSRYFVTGTVYASI
jgi:hypothetical protein